MPLKPSNGKWEKTFNKVVCTSCTLWIQNFTYSYEEWSYTFNTLKDTSTLFSWRNLGTKLLYLMEMSFFAVKFCCSAY